VITAIPSHYSRVFFTCARVMSPVRGVDLCAQQPAQSTDSGVSCHLKFLTFSNRGQHTFHSGYLNFHHVFSFLAEHIQHQILFSLTKASVCCVLCQVFFIWLMDEARLPCHVIWGQGFLLSWCISYFCPHTHTHIIRWSLVSHIMVLVP
jgi:hypothetical protein